MIITIDSLKSAIRNRKSWKDYDWEKVGHKLWMDRVMEEINRLTAISTNATVSTSSREYGYNTRSYRYYDFEMGERNVFRPINGNIEVDMPNLRTDIGTYYGWGF